MLVPAILAMTLSVSEPMGDAAMAWHTDGDAALAAHGRVGYDHELAPWERGVSARHGGDGRVATLLGGYLEGTLDPALGLTPGKGVTLYLRLQALNKGWQSGIASLTDQNGAVAARIYAEDRNHGQNLELVFETYDGAGMSTHLRCPLKPLRIGTWHDLVFVLGDEGLVFYAEGVQRGAMGVPGPFADAAVTRICVGHDDTERPAFLGHIDHAVLWGRRLTDDEAKSLGGRSPEEELAMVADRVAKVGPRVALDPCRPIYHVTGPVGLMGDPNGPVMFEGRAHLMYQSFPYFMDEEYMLPGWGHMVSDDLVHWEHLPAAMMPVPGSYDAAACASGCCVVNDGEPTIVYTSAAPQTQSIATSQDGMRTWTKYAGNPVVANPPEIENLSDGFRDPFCWHEDDGWYMIVGSAINEVGGTLPLYRSTDLRNWEYLHPLCTGTDPDCMQWECPNFFPLGDKHVLVISPLLHSSAAIRGDVIYAIGDYRDHRFVPDAWHTLDLGGHPNYYAPNSFVDDRGRRLMWGMIGVGGSAGYPWHGAQTLLRELTLRPDGRLGIAPIPELTALRGRAWHAEGIAIDGPAMAFPEGLAGECLELQLRIDPGDATAVGLDVRCSDDGARWLPIRFNIAESRFSIGDRKAPFALLDSEKELSLRVFLDRRVVEVYLNGREVMTGQVHHGPRDTMLRFSAEGGTARCVSLDAWEMNGIW